MIAVVGLPVLRAAEPEPEPDGLAVGVAAVASAAGAAVEIIGNVGNDRAGDALLLGLARIGVGHVAMLRDPARATPIRAPTPEVLDLAADDADDADADDADAGRPGSVHDETIAPALDGPDVELALRYLSDVRVIVAIHPTDAVRDVVVAAASWTGAHLVLVVRDGDARSAIPGQGLVVEAGPDDRDSAVGEAIGRYAAAIDRGEEADAAYAAFAATAREG